MQFTHFFSVIQKKNKQSQRGLKKDIGRLDQTKGFLRKAAAVELFILSESILNGFGSSSTAL